MTREEHITWTKQRALAELDGGRGPDGIASAIASVQSDLRKHPDTADHSALDLMMLEVLGGFMRTEQQVRHFIEGIR